MNTMKVFWIALLLLTGCSDSSEEPPAFVIANIYNRLVLPVTIYSNGTNLGNIGAYASTVLTLPRGTRSITWSAHVTVLSDGLTISSDLHDVSVSIPDQQNFVDVNNIVNGKVWIAPTITNTSGGVRSIGIWNGASIRCVVVLPVFATATISYFLLTPQTRVVSFASTNCTGSSSYWTNQQLQGFDAVSGALRLNASL
jgi:hypothetical protein